MPFTPFHAGPGLCVALPLKKYLDLPVFIGANAVVDIEPLFIGLFKPYLFAHGYWHTLLFGCFLGTAWAIIAYFSKDILLRLMHVLCLPYKTNFPKMLFSAIMGAWFHVLLDAPLYPEIQPFFPLKGNPLFGLISYSTAHGLYFLCFIPAAILYIFAVKQYKRKQGISFFNG